MARPAARALLGGPRAPSAAMPPPSAASDCALLGVSHTATPDEIRRAFRRRALALHPDRNASAEAADEFRRLREAYDRLRGPGAQQRREIERVTADLLAAAQEAQRRRAGFGLPRAPWQRVRVPLAATLRDRLRRRYSPATWAVEAHAGGLDDLRWDVRVGWADVEGVAADERTVSLTLTPAARQRVAAEAPGALHGATYVLPTPDPARLATIVRRRAGCD